MRPNIADGDLTIKTNKITELLEKGHKVKVAMYFRGRENANKDIGKTKITDLVDQIVQAGAVLNSPLKSKGNSIFAILDKKKK